MRKRELIQRLKQQLNKCAGFEGDDVAAAREKALDYYFQRLRGDEVTGRSAVVSGDLSAMVEANLAQMLEAFSGDEIIEFSPTGPEDEDQAQLESETVTDFLMGRNNGFLQFATAIKDALLLRNGLLKVWIDETSFSKSESYSNVTAEALAELLHLRKQQGAECKVNKFKGGELSLRCTYTRREFRAESIPPENFLYVGDWDSLDLQDIPFCAEHHVNTRSRLLELGFAKDTVWKLPKYQQRSGKLDGAARNPQKLMTDAVGIDDSQELIEWYEAYVLIDKDGDGISERRKICFSAPEILADEPANLVPYAAGTAIINPHRFLGVSLFDKLKQVQDINTGLQRALMDNVNTTTKNRLAYLDGAANVDDIADGRPNGAIRVRRTVQDVRQAVMPFQVPDTSANILQNIEFQKSVRTELGGASLELASGQLQIGDRVGSQGIDRAYSVMEALAAMMTKIVAQSLITNTALLAHATLRENYVDDVPIKRHGKWQTAKPSEWPERRRVIVKPGMSPGERQRKAAALAEILASQKELAALGMDKVLVDVNGFYRTMMDWARAVEIRNPEQYFIDPESPQSQQALQAKEQQSAQADQEKKNLMTGAITLQQIEIALNKYRHDSQLQFDYWKETMTAEIEEAKLAAQAVLDMLKQQQTGIAGGLNGSEKGRGIPPGQ